MIGEDLSVFPPAQSGPYDGIGEHITALVFLSGWPLWPKETFPLSLPRATLIPDTLHRDAPATKVATI